MIRTIETHPLGSIQKVTTPKGAARFQVVPTGTAGDASGVTPCSTLAEARAKLGVVIRHPEKLTTPKSECPHNLPGYKAATHSTAAAKGKRK